LQTYRTARAEGVSQREAARKAGLPRSTLRGVDAVVHRTGVDSERDSLLLSPAGHALVRDIIDAVLFVFCLAGGVGLPTFRRFLQLAKLDGYVASSHAIGQFATAYQLAFLPSALLGSSIGSVFFQRASLDFAERRAFAPMWRNTLVRTTWMGLPICILTALAGPYMFPVLLSAKWEQAGRIAAILSVPAFFAFVTGSVDRCWAIVGVNWYMPALQLLKSASSLAAAGAAHVFKLTFDRCLFLLAFQMSAIYVLDGYWEMRFVQEADARSRRAFP